MADDTPRTLAHRFFRTCLLLLGGILALWLGLELLARFWGWLLLVGVLIGVIAALITGYRIWRESRW